MTKPDCAAETFRPAYALSIWVDTRYIYCEIPAKEGPPLVMKYAKTEGGLSKALSLMSSRAAEVTNGKGHYQVVEPKISNKVSPYTDIQREKARDILKRRGLI